MASQRSRQPPSPAQETPATISFLQWWYYWLLCKRVMTVMLCVTVLMIPICIGFLPTIRPYLQLSRGARSMEDDVISHTQDVWLGRISAGKSHSTMYTLNFWYSYAKRARYLAYRSFPGAGDTWASTTGLSYPPVLCSVFIRSTLMTEYPDEDEEYTGFKSPI